MTAALYATGLDMPAFEQHVLSQSATSADHYDDAYFTDEWRAGGHSYKLDVRREIEGRNPALIKDVFAPERVLDVGCGPGALMYFLWELDVNVEGVDFSPQSRELAPEPIRDRIIVGSVTDTALFADASYDLVICREVIEHLTLLETRKLVQNLCRVSARFIYITTRFFPNPTSILDVTHEKHVDPTHITVMTKDLLRLLLVLEGFRSRPDLEERLDWLDKGRVLVYERAT
jgi:SAM-dependent methyltransferase